MHGRDVRRRDGFISLITRLPALVVIDDDPDQAELLSDLLRHEGWAVTTFTDPCLALEQLRSEAVPCDLVLSDIAMPVLDGLTLCKKLHDSRPDLEVIIVTGESRLETAVGSLRAGAYDFLTKPIQLELLMPCVRRALERHALTHELRRLREAVPPESLLFGESPSIKRVQDLLMRVAPSGANVLVQGETGTGKELVARALHSQSPRAAGPFVGLNCAALPAPLLESELFGHARGAFTDAKAAREGLFVEANGGTLFLDEVAELPAESQAKLLRAFQERTVRPVGANVEVPFDARIVSATHKDLEAEVEAGRFRQDLFFRLNVIKIELPPLRERGMDILRIANRFLERAAQKEARTALTISPAVAQKLLAYSWPGNVRELENTLERVMALARFAEVAVDDLPAKVRHFQPEQFSVIADAPEEVVTLAELEKRYLLRVLKVVNDNRSRAAQLLGIDRRTLYRKLEAYSLATQTDSDVAPGGAASLLPSN